MRSRSGHRIRAENPHQNSTPYRTRALERASGSHGELRGRTAGGGAVRLILSRPRRPAMGERAFNPRKSTTGRRRGTVIAAATLLVCVAHSAWSWSPRCVPPHACEGRSDCPGISIQSHPEQLQEDFDTGRYSRYRNGAECLQHNNQGDCVQYRVRCADGHPPQSNEDWTVTEGDDGAWIVTWNGGSGGPGGPPTSPPIEPPRSPSSPNGPGGQGQTGAGGGGGGEAASASRRAARAWERRQSRAQLRAVRCSQPAR